MPSVERMLVEIFECYRHVTIIRDSDGEYVMNSSDGEISKSKHMATLIRDAWLSIKK